MWMVAHESTNISLFCSVLDSMGSREVWLRDINSGDKRIIEKTLIIAS